MGRRALGIVTFVHNYDLTSGPLGPCQIINYNLFM